MAGQNCSGTFIRRSRKTTRQAPHQIRLVNYLSLMSTPVTSFHPDSQLIIIVVTHVYTSNIIWDGKRMKMIHLEKCWFSCCFRMTWHRISSTQFPQRQLWGLRHSASSLAFTEAPYLSSSATASTWPYIAATCSGVLPREGGHEACPTSGRQRRRIVGKLASCASCTSRKSHSPTVQHKHVDAI